MKMNHRSSVVVRRTSHCHHTPHALRAHKGPVTSGKRQNSTVSSAALTASWSPFSERLNRYIAEPHAHTNAERKVTDAEGT